MWFFYLSMDPKPGDLFFYSFVLKLNKSPWEFRGPCLGLWAISPVHNNNSTPEMWSKKQSCGFYTGFTVNGNICYEPEMNWICLLDPWMQPRFLPQSDGLVSWPLRRKYPQTWSGRIKQKEYIRNTATQCIQFILLYSLTVCFKCFYTVTWHVKGSVSKSGWVLFVKAWKLDQMQMWKWQRSVQDFVLSFIVLSADFLKVDASTHHNTKGQVVMWKSLVSKVQSKMWVNDLW